MVVAVQHHSSWIRSFGLLAHAKKVKAPAWRQIYSCGFEYIHHSRPEVQIPLIKSDRAIAMIKYLMGRKSSTLSRLALAVVIGRLQSFVPVTPGNIGAMFLHSLYQVLHEDDGSGLKPTDPGYYYRPAHMRRGTPYYDGHQCCQQAGVGKRGPQTRIC